MILFKYICVLAKAAYLPADVGKWTRLLPRNLSVLLYANSTSITTNCSCFSLDALGPFWAGDFRISGRKCTSSAGELTSGKRICCSWCTAFIWGYSTWVRKPFLLPSFPFFRGINLLSFYFSKSEAEVMPLITPVSIVATDEYQSTALHMASFGVQ